MKVIRLMPKTSFVDSYAQNASEATDVGDYKEGTLIATTEGLTGTDQVEISIYTANVNDKNAYLPLLNSGELTPTASNPTASASFEQTSNPVGRFIRVQIEPTFSGSSGYSGYVNVEVTLQPKRS